MGGDLLYLPTFRNAENGVNCLLGMSVDISINVGITILICVL